MGRPLRNPGQRLDQRREVLLTRVEAEALDRAAKAAGLTRSDAMRAAILEWCSDDVEDLHPELSPARPDN